MNLMAISKKRREASVIYEKWRQQWQGMQIVTDFYQPPVASIFTASAEPNTLYQAIQDIETQRWPSAREVK